MKLKLVITTVTSFLLILSVEYSVRFSGGGMLTPSVADRLFLPVYLVRICRIVLRCLKLALPLFENCCFYA